ncbi:hypothetical protein NCC49_005097 [Naganishia albida]|nr:hypothetical protein NCC49_005097 [Naganishia albida]
MASLHSPRPSQLTDAGSLETSANSQYADTASFMVMSEEHLAMFGAAVANAAYQQAYQQAIGDFITALSVMLSSAMSENSDTQSQMSAGPMSALSRAESAATTAAESVLAPSVVESGQPKDLSPEQQQRTSNEQIDERAPLNNDEFEEPLDAELEELRKQAEATAGLQTAPEVPKRS